MEILGREAKDMIDAVTKIGLLAYFERIIESDAGEIKQGRDLSNYRLGRLEAIRTISEIIGLKADFLKIVDKKLKEISTECAPLLV